MTNKNKLILVLLAALVFVVIISVLKPSKNEKTDKVVEAELNSTPVTLSDADAKTLKETLGLTADTPDNTLRTLAITLKAQKEENAVLKSRLDEQQKQSKSAAESLQERLNTGLADLQIKFDKEVGDLKNALM